MSGKWWLIRACVTKWNGDLRENTISERMLLTLGFQIDLRSTKCLGRIHPLAQIYFTPNLINGEDYSIKKIDCLDFNKWSIPKIDVKTTNKTSWIESAFN